MTFGEKIRHSRMLQGLSQADLAAKTGLNPSAISHFEKGRRKPSFENLQRLAKSLSITSDYLLDLPFSLKINAHTRAAWKTE